MCGLSEQLLFDKARQMSAPSEFSPESQFAENPPFPGGGDIWCLGPTETERLAACCALLLSASNGEARIYRKVVALIPPDGTDEADLQAAVANYILARLPDEEPEDVERWVRARLEVRRPPTLDVDDLVNELPAAETANIAVVVADAARFVCACKDDWVATVVRIAERACAIARVSKGYVVVDTGMFRPTEPHALETLMSVEDCGVATAELVERSVEALQEQLNEVSTLAQEGRYGEAFARADDLPISDATKLALKAKVFLLAGTLPQAVATLKQIRDQRLVVSSEQSLQFARIAELAQGSQVASDFVADAVIAASSPKELEACLAAADDLGFVSSAATAVERLAAAAPHSTVLLEHRVAKARKVGDHRHAAELLEAGGREDESAFESRLAKCLEAHRPRYDAVIDELSNEPLRAAAVLRSAFIDAQRHHHHLPAVELLLARLDKAEESEARIAWLISAMREALLNDRAADADNLVAALVAVTDVALARLSRYPEDSPTRARLGNLLATDASGVLGRFSLRQIFIRRAASDPDASAVRPDMPDVSAEDIKAFAIAGKAWLEGLEALVVGRSRALATDVPTCFHAGILRQLIDGIEGLTRDLNEPGSIEALLNYVAVIAAFAPHLKGDDKNMDIEALKLASTSLAKAGHAQRARDLIETVLQTVEGDSRRARAAWIAYGEVHRMTGDPYEAAIAISAALGCEVPITSEEAWYELLAVHRLARDLREPALAHELLDKAEGLQVFDLSPQAPSRIETMRLQIELASTIAEASAEPASLEAFIARVTTAGRAVLAVGDDPAPISAILVQALRFARACDVPVSREAGDVAAELLKKMSKGAVQRLSRFSRDPTIDDLKQSAAELHGARFGRNFVQDVAPLVKLARRHLASDALTANGAAFAIELLADHGLLGRDSAGDEFPADLPASPSEVLATAQAISKTGLSVCLLGLNEGGRLVRVEVVDGVVGVPVLESTDVFSHRRLKEWRRDYPYEYAFLSEPDQYDRVPDAFHLMQLFENSVRGLGVSSMSLQPVVLVTDAQLADLPANLLPVNGVFAGENRAVAVAPSLHWLKRAAERRTQACGPAFAWVPSDSAKPEDVLQRLADDLKPILAEAEIASSNAIEMPSQLRGAELAIVGGHGGLAAVEGRFFRGVADEARKTISGDRLARGLLGSKVAILFVCSGGRLDLEPGAQASLGLARMLLDRGCSAVIGSPWPLSGDVPGRWLPTFLDCWNRGVSIVDANALANEKVRGQADSRHAMHVYGDPMITKYQI